MRYRDGENVRGDTDPQRTSRIIRIAAAITMCGLLLLGAVRYASGTPGFAPTLVIGGTLSLLAIWINRRGYVVLSGVLFVAVLAGIAVFLMVFSEGTHDAALLTFPGILVLAALTLPRKPYIVVAALVVLIPGIVGVLEISGKIVNIYSGNTDFLSVLDITVILILTAAAVELMTATVTESAARARMSESRFRLLFNNSSESIFVFGAIGPEGLPEQIIEVNDIACNQLGYTREEVLRLRPPDIFQEESKGPMAAGFSRLRAEGSAVCEGSYRTKDGARIPVEVSMQLFDMQEREAIITNARDITERKRTDDLIRSALREKEVLLREIHHRVKNNMQVVSSLLNLQASQTQDAVTKAMLEESRQRVRSIAIIHEKLYNSSNLARIDFSIYLKSVADELLRTFGRSNISCVLALESIPFEIDKAIPVGLVVNELLTNALRHAFPSGTPGTVRVGLRSLGDDQVELVVRDDGVGFPAGITIAAATTMGLAIVRTLVEQMHGTITVEGTHGTTCTVRFALNKRIETSLVS
jgi:PAS domain S-box-containing protein